MPAKVPRIVTSQNVTGDEHGKHRGHHEGEHRNDRTQRQPRDATDAMPGRAAAAECGADSNKQTCDDEHRQADRRWANVCISGCYAQHGGSADKSQDESQPPGSIGRRRRWQQTTDDPADARDAPCQRH
jgi:hypothetical protein